MTTTGTLERNHGTFEGVGRLRLQYRSWEVPAPKAAVVFVHGFSDHSGRYESFAETLATFGVSCGESKSVTEALKQEKSTLEDRKSVV